MSHSSEQEIIARLSHAPCGKTVVNHLSENCAHSMLNACRWCAMCGKESKAQLDTLELYSGVELCFQTYLSSQFTHRHDAPASTVMEINHCRAGRIGWRMKDGLSLYLGEGDVSLHSMSRCTQSEIEFPLHCYEGLFFSVDLDALDANPPELMREAALPPAAYTSDSVRKTVPCFPLARRMRQSLMGCIRLTERFSCPTRGSSFRS